MYILLGGGGGEVPDPDGEAGLAEGEGRGGERGELSERDEGSGDGDEYV